MRIYWPVGVRKPTSREDALSLLVESDAYASRIQEKMDRLLIKSDDPNDCWGWAGSLTTQGYARVSMFKGVEARGNRVAFVLSSGRLPVMPVVAHSCDNPTCCNPRHLREATQSENLQECVRRGRHVPHRAKSNRHARRLTEEQVAFIRAHYRRSSRDWGQAAMGRRFGVTQTAIYFLVNGRTYREAVTPRANHPPTPNS